MTEPAQLVFGIYVFSSSPFLFLSDSHREQFRVDACDHPASSLDVSPRLGLVCDCEPRDLQVLSWGCMDFTGRSPGDVGTAGGIGMPFGTCISGFEESGYEVIGNCEFGS